MIWLLLSSMAVAWLSMRYAWWRRSADPRCPRILMYHMVSEPKKGKHFNGLRVSPQVFAWQLQWLKEHGWQACSVSELVENADKLPEKSVAISFDDGYADNFYNALPLLQRYGFSATLYLVVDRHGRDWSVQRKAHHNDGELQGEAKLSDAQVEDMLASGCIELGSHTLTHANLLQLSADQAREELQRSKETLQRRFGVEVKSFAYPFGLYSAEHVALVAQAGYTNAVTTHEGVDCPRNWQPLELKRVKISGRDNRLAFRLRMRTGYRSWR